MVMVKLIKKVCQECYKKRGWKWTGIDESRWQMGQIICVDEYGRLDACRLSEIPENCRYKLEQIVIKKRPK